MAEWVDGVGAVGWDGDGLPAAEICLVFGLALDAEARGAQHGFDAGAVRDAPVGEVPDALLEVGLPGGLD
jgi:hypothetical protein